MKNRQDQVTKTTIPLTPPNKSNNKLHKISPSTPQKRMKRTQTPRSTEKNVGPLTTFSSPSYNKTKSDRTTIDLITPEPPRKPQTENISTDAFLDSGSGGESSLNLNVNNDNNSNDNDNDEVMGTQQVLDTQGKNEKDAEMSENKGSNDEHKEMEVDKDADDKETPGKDSGMDERKTMRQDYGDMDNMDNMEEKNRKVTNNDKEEEAQSVLDETTPELSNNNNNESRTKETRIKSESMMNQNVHQLGIIQENEEDYATKMNVDHNNTRTDDLLRNEVQIDADLDVAGHSSAGDPITFGELRRHGYSSMVCLYSLYM